MGLFDKFLNTVSYEYVPKSEAEAMYAILIACGAIDGEISDDETQTTSALLTFHPLFKDKSTADFIPPVFKGIKESGAKAVIDAAIKVFPASSKVSVFIFCMEVILSDGQVGHKEKEIIDYLTEHLSIPVDKAEQIIEVLLSKYKLN